MVAQSPAHEINDIPTGFTDADGVHAKTWEEKFQADESTLEGRAWSSDLLAAFRTAQAYFAREYHDELRKAYGSDWAKVLDQSFKVYAALMDAGAKSDDSKAQIRRFPLPAWEAQTYLSRVSVPRGLSKEEFERFSAKMSRAWDRLGWVWVHKLQYVTGAGLFERDVKDFAANRDKQPAIYTDCLVDLLLATIREARKSRSRRVPRFEIAFERCYKQFRESNRIRPYAPEAPPKVASDAPPSKTTKATPSSPTLELERITRRAAARAGEIAKQLPADERDACGMAFLAWAGEEWEKATGRPLPVPPVYKEGDNTFSEDGQNATSSPSPQRAKFDFAAENSKTAAASGDNLSAGTPASEILEYDPDPEPRGVNLAQAKAAADACASVDVERVKVIFVDDTKAKFEDSCTFAEEVSISEFQERLPVYLERNRLSRIESMTVRVRFKGMTQLLQIDDCVSEVMEALAPYAFLQFWTSPACGQTFLAFADRLTVEQYEDVRYRILNGRIAATGANGGAHGAMRWPGSLNRKPKRRYGDGESPRVQLSRAAMGRKVSVAELEAAGLLAASRPQPIVEDARVIRGKFPNAGDFPDMNYYLAQTGGERSTAEMKWCVRALGMGHTRVAVESELRRIGEKARVRRNDSYVRDTVNRAAQHVGLNSSRPRESYAGGAA